MEAIVVIGSLKIWSHWLETRFELISRLRHDDGAVVSVNGREVYRDANVVLGVGFSTYADALSPSEATDQPVTLFYKLGNNVIAIVLP